MIRPLYPEMALTDEYIRARLMAMRALRHCGVIRARHDHPAFASLERTGDAVGRLRPGETLSCDFRLTPRGRDMANAVLQPCTRL